LERSSYLPQVLFLRPFSIGLVDKFLRRIARGGIIISGVMGGVVEKAHFSRYDNA
jgi:hypothetical protein